MALMMTIFSRKLHLYFSNYETNETLLKSKNLVGTNACLMLILVIFLSAKPWVSKDLKIKF